MFLTEAEHMIRQHAPLRHTTGELESPFPLLYPAHLPLVFHLIPLDAVRRQTISPTFFAELSSVGEQRHLQVIHVWEDLWYSHTAIVQGRLLALLGKSRRIHGRSTKVQRTDKKTAAAFLHTHHLQDYTDAYYKYALFGKDEPVAVALFSKARVMHDGRVPYRSYELVRFAGLTGHTITGGLSKLVQAFVHDQHPAHLMTYADRDWSSGAGYRKLGFVAAGDTEPHAFYVHPETYQRHSARQLPESLSGEGKAETAGYLRITNAGSRKFILDLRQG